MDEVITLLARYKHVNHIENNNELVAKEVKVRFHCLLQLCSALLYGFS